MRDPKRIDKFCAMLAKTWRKAPDWRFFQFMQNIMEEYYSKEVLREMVWWDSQYMEYTSQGQTITGFNFGPISEYSVCPTGTYKIALVLDLNPLDRDYHWYRQNSDGTWSHKPANFKVENWDYNGNPIYNPKYCDRRDSNTGHNYTVFAGFYYVSPSAI